MKIQPALPSPLTAARKVPTSSRSAVATDNYNARRARNNGAIASTAGKRPPR